MGSAANESSLRFWESEESLKALLSWYREQGRQLWWRNTRDPYTIWVTETLLQQTRISQAAATIERFLARFPSLEKLASASLEAVLEIWQGLGYYQRAHNLYKTALIVWEKGGFEPLLKAHDPLKVLLSLSGIGDYTARAILCFCGHSDYLPVDGNVLRVLSRLTADATPSSQRKVFQQKADILPPSWRTREVGYAFMDLAQLICTPKRPRCLLCPLQRVCKALSDGEVLRYPVRPPARPKPTQHFLFYLSANAEGVWLEKRTNQGLWGGLWCLPFTVLQEAPSTPPTFMHEFTHFQLIGHLERLKDPLPHTSLIPWKDLRQYGLPAPLRRLLTREAETYGATLSTE
ncbi:MAG: A/G-specific adenine glycosylase [Bacteroidia bacterium]|nr:A/G-specific adenine glycosylase [Bacteroidia bacterium]MDW8134645.1 A/G-specific adenine glycosylase [Bacteroidia bacterium]